MMASHGSETKAGIGFGAGYGRGSSSDDGSGEGYCCGSGYRDYSGDGSGYVSGKYFVSGKATGVGESDGSGKCSVVGDNVYFLVRGVIKEARFTGQTEWWITLEEAEAELAVRLMRDG